MTEPVDILVAVPAHDEAATIGGCLEAVLASVAEAQRAGAVRRARVAVSAHRCRDDTEVRALDHLTGRPGIEPVVRPEPAALPVGAVRSRLIEHAWSAGVPLADDGWILSTDADTVVPRDWVTGLLGVACGERADLVLGLADLGDWPADEPSRQRYRALLAAGIHGDRHDHVYAANLAISRSAYQAVGGFPAVPHGEEHGLLQAVRRRGGRVASPLSPRVVTSARMPGRAADGLGALLSRLAGSPAGSSASAAGQ